MTQALLSQLCGSPRGVGDADQRQKPESLASLRRGTEACLSKAAGLPDFVEAPRSGQKVSFDSCRSKEYFS
jgi:hypothetical protein